MNDYSIEQCLEELLNYDIKIDNSLYINNNGIKVPRVTDILSKCINEESIIQWANSLGFKHKSYTKELQAAADIGSMAHSSIEQFLRNKIESDNIPFKAFKFWWNAINECNTIKVLGIEEKLVCDYFGGTYDTLYSINDKNILVDYKTSNHITYKYMLQLAAYRYMLYYTKNINIDGMIILQLGKSDPYYSEVFVDLHREDHYNYIEKCTNAFLSLVYSYYNINYAKEEYKILF